MPTSFYRLNRDTFVNDAMHYAGEVVEIDDKVFAPNTAGADVRGPSVSKIDASEASATAQLPTVPIANHGPSSPGAEHAQGLPPGSVQRGNVFLTRDQDGTVSQLVPSTRDTDPALAASMEANVQRQAAGEETAQARADASLDEQRAAEAATAGPGGNMTKDELKAYLDSEGISYPPKAEKAELQKLAAAGKPGDPNA